MARIGKYELLEQLGSGSMGTVYRGRDTILDRPVAIKTIQTGDNVAEDIRERFYREARVCARLKHPNVVSVYDLGEEDGT
jgi:eukaryotic-like serine/threonine-protein kinase